MQTSGEISPSFPGPRRHYRAYKSLEDAEIVARCQAGDSDAIEELIRRYRRSIYALAHRLIYNQEDANDAASDAILRLLQNIDKCKCTKTLPAWINRIVVNCVYDWCRNARRRRAASLDELVEKGNDAPLPFLDLSERPLSFRLMAKEQSVLLRQAIVEMPRAHAELLLQYYVEERSYDEISRGMQIPMGTIKSRLSRARRVLARKLYRHRMAFVD